jgi:hypothetical protein
MKKTFGISVNVFDDSIELLPSMLKNIRPHVDHISVIFQTISNIGIPSTEDVQGIVEDLKNQGLIDVIFHYKPSISQGSHFNEISKRNLGLLIAKENNIDYFLTADQDEYYLDIEFNKMKQYYLDNDIEAGYCQMQTYYKSKEYCYEIPEEYYVSLFFKLNDKSFFKLADPAPVLVDPSRNISTDKYKIFDRNEIEMHHLSYVRKNIEKKFLNSSARVNFDKNISTLIDYYNSWEVTEPLMKAMSAGTNLSFNKLKRVDTWNHLEI